MWQLSFYVHDRFTVKTSRNLLCYANERDTADEITAGVHERKKKINKDIHLYINWAMNDSEKIFWKQ